MYETRIDWVVVLIAAVLNMLVGFLWYSKWLFANEWMKHHKITENDLKKMGASCMLWGFIVSLVIAYFIALFEGKLGIANVTDGMFFGFCIWLGFVATTQISGVIWNKQPLKMFLIDTSCKLVSLLVMGGVIAA
jgi:hypothetical protein